MKTDDICLVTDTLQMARQMYPGKRNNLDALCDRLGIDNSKRTLHGALLDAEILADVYLMIDGGGKQIYSMKKNLLSLKLSVLCKKKAAEEIKSAVDFSHNLKLLQPTNDELQAHLELLKMLNKKKVEIIAFGINSLAIIMCINRLEFKQVSKI